MRVTGLAPWCPAQDAAAAAFSRGRPGEAQPLEKFPHTFNKRGPPGPAHRQRAGRWLLRTPSWSRTRVTQCQRARPGKAEGSRRRQHGGMPPDPPHSGTRSFPGLFPVGVRDPASVCPLGAGRKHPCLVGTPSCGHRALPCLHSRGREPSCLASPRAHPVPAVRLRREASLGRASLGVGLSLVAVRLSPTSCPSGPSLESRPLTLAAGLVSAGVWLFLQGWRGVRASSHVGTSVQGSGRLLGPSLSFSLCSLGRLPSPRGRGCPRVRARLSGCSLQGLL